jgi:pSer/pThr/pTyr-binding forkhead associated (FHA) protein
MVGAAALAPPPPVRGAGGGYAAPPPVPAAYGGAPAPPMVAGLNSTHDRVAPPRPIAEAGGAPVLIGFLVTFQNEPTGKFWPLRSGRTTLGRSGVDNEADVALQDASASARHAVVQGDPATGQAFVEDGGSRNGTFINEEKLDKGSQRQLHDNDRLRLGSITLVVKLLASG